MHDATVQVLPSMQDSEVLHPYTFLAWLSVPSEEHALLHRPCDRREWALTGELSGVWVVEMAGGFETEAGGSHQISLEDDGEGHVAVWRCPSPSPGRSRGGGSATGGGQLG